MSDDGSTLPGTEPQPGVRVAALTFPVAEGAERLGVTEGWYLTQLRARKLPGHKIANRWRLTDDDVAQALQLTAVPAIAPVADPAGLTPGSRRRLERRAQR
ncbi:DNA-binding protein [Rhodococcus sp. 1168]|uniref:DNA-binding protein n=1 Tax=Rhodococcus sp. 1168 TaxID=2018041 RepID=UPI000F746D78|nr:DNA-binding protein [Rhodococcus sp. 1168]